MNRGSPERSRRPCNKGYCFNEAPIHESGKSQGRHRHDDLPLGFNEAPIHESGKWIHWPSGRVYAPAASMRPRFMNRGSAPTATSAAEWPGSFNEAPIHESGKSRGSPLRGRREIRFNEAPIHESGKYGKGKEEDSSGDVLQ